MKIKQKVIATSLGFGLLFWLIDSFIAYTTPLYGGGSFLEVLFTNVPKTAIYLRLTVLGFFIIFGLLMANILVKSKKTTDELSESEEKFRGISASAKDAIIMADHDGNISYWNEAAEIIFRYRRKDVIGRDFKFLVPEKYYEFLDSGFKRFRKTGYAPIIGKTIELSGIRKGGDEIPIEISLSSVKIRNKWNALGIVRDITERKIAEKELMIKDLAVDSTINAIALAEPRGKLTYVNPAFLNMWGYEEDDVIGRHLVEFWQDEHKALDILDSIREKGKFIGESKAKRKDESQFDVQISASMVKDDVDKPLTTILSFIDITERKEVEKKLEVRSKFEKLVTTISTNFINLPSEKIDNEIKKALQSIGEFAAVDQSYVIQYTSDKKHMKMTHEWCSNTGTPLLQTNQNLSVEDHRWHTAQINTRETIYITDKSEIPPNAGSFLETLEARGSTSLIHVPIAYGGKAFGFVGLESQQSEKTWSVDIIVLLRMVGDILANALERNRVEEQLNASLKEKEVLLKEIHHRVKNNMQVISSLLNLQSSRITNQEILEMFKESQGRIRSMSLIHERLYQSADLAKIDFSHYIQNLATYLFQSYRIDPKTVILNTDVQDVSLDINKAIPCGLIINELVSNSLKYAFSHVKDSDKKKEEKGKIDIQLTADDGKVTLLVRDNGVGLPKELDIETADSFGLQLVTTLVIQLNGKINIKRKPGATFTITFDKTNKHPNS
ncbi:MAG: PAS domain S-box protein [Candidatus Aminicenantes bacterium]|nr:MAG: PAS domain S-box protein [Candidatus Aminicenantes bacterium]